ncbi:MAG: uroporphyrinogen decarboxylase family protein [Anaerolineae bacterium]|nr:uroporphyrinogen decarboxylase family protein [Anaerolineae bacterium]
MESRERVTRALRFQRPDRAPRDLWMLPGVTMFRQDEVRAVQARFPSDFAGPDATYGRGERERGTRYLKGQWVDEWGCTWEAAEDGVAGEVKGPPLADWSALDSHKPPYEVLRNADMGRVDDSCRQTSRFVLAGTLIRPFERMQFLRGSQNLFLDLGYAPAGLFRLRDMLHEFALQELELWCATAVDGISFMDDWGSMRGLLISPKTWRELYKPLYAEYCQRIHRSGKFTFFHSDGNITEIIPDLIEIGVDALNSQLFCMDLEGVAERFRGRITFWGELDRQHILPFGSVEDVRQAVRRVRRALDTGEGGVIAEFEWGNDTPLENVMAAFAAWEERLEQT